MTRHLLGFARRLAAAVVAITAFSTLVVAQGLPGLKEFLERGYRIVGVAPDGNNQVIYLQQEGPTQGSLVMCFLVKNERGIFNYSHCDHVIAYPRKPVR